MKRTLLFNLIALLLSSMIISAQPVTTPDGKYGVGGTKVTTVHDNGLGVRTTTVEYYDNENPPKMREREEQIDNLIEKELTIKKTKYTRDERVPKVEETTEIRKNARGDTIYKEEIYYEDGKPSDGTRRVRLPDMSWEKYKFNDKTNTFDLVKEPMLRVKENGRIGYLADTCNRNVSAFAGYSYLNAGQEGESESFPVGAHVAITFHLLERLGIVLDGSFHKKKVNELEITRAFLMGGIQYQLMKRRQQQVLIPLARLLLGIATDKQKYEFGSVSDVNKANAFAFAFGLGLDCRLNRMIAAALLVDYIHTGFNDESQSNFRASLGILINLGCKK